MIALLAAFGAGLLTTLNPCVLPILPIVVATAFSGGRLGPLALVAGMVCGFVGLGVAVAATGSLFGIAPEIIRTAAALLFVVAGLVFLVPPLQDRLAAAMQPLADRASGLSGQAGTGVAGQFLIGLLLGLVWTPCTGPSLGAAVSLAAQAGGLGEAALRMAVFGLGAGALLLLFAYGSRAALAGRRGTLMSVAERAKPIAGLIFVALGLVVLLGFDKQLEAALTRLMPDWLVDFTTQL
jgi:cytochrome c biogenesis protein CcdA